MYRRLFVVISLVGSVVLSRAVHAEGSSALFPLGKSWAGDRTLPRPAGIGLVLYYQTQDYELRNLAVTLPNAALAEASGVEFRNETNEQHIQVDLWVLPFLNVFGIVGNVDGQTTVELVPPLHDIEVDYDGLVYGGGLTLAAGGKRFFGSLSSTFTGTDLEASTSSVEAWILSSRVGVRVKRAAFWGGAMYQKTEERHRGRISLPLFGEVGYDVEFEAKKPWNALAGLSIDLSERWKLELEGGFAGRNHALVSVGYRF